MSLPDPVRILVTGASGFVGRHLVNRLAAAIPAGGEIVLADASAANPPQRANCRLSQLDITDAEQVEALVGSAKPTHLIHLAAIAAVTAASNDVRKAWEVNFGGSLNVALALVKHVPECRLIYCSSAEVYGASFGSGAPLDETALLKPVNSYGAAKAAADLMFGQMARHDLRVVRVRPFNHTGPGQNVKFVIPSFASQIARIERGLQDPVIHVGDLSSQRDFLDVLDVVDAYVAALVNFDRIPNGTIMNIASGEARVVRAVLDDLLAMSNIKIDVVVDADRLRPSDTPVVVGKADRARDLLGWQPKRPWQATLKSVLEFWRAQPLQNLQSR